MDKEFDKFLGLSLIAQEKLQATICSIPGKKNLVLESCLIKPLEHVCSASWLRLKGIQRIYKFDADNKIQCDEVLVFMISSRLRLFKEILDYIQELVKLSGNTTDDLSMKKYHIICVPNCFVYFSMILETEGLYGKVQLHRFSWDFIVIDDGILSMEIPFVFPTVFLHRDTSILPAIAHSIRILKLISGEPDLIIAYGAQSSNILKMLKALGNIENEKKPSPKLDILMFVDRDKDYASSLLTPAIYAGLLLEVFDMHAGELIVEKDTNKILRQKLKIFLLPKEQKASSDNATKNLKIKLSSKSDEIYAENRFRHFTQVSGIIRTAAKNISAEAQKLNDMKLEEMHEYVARKLPKITELKAKVLRHLNASEQIIEQLARNFSRIGTLEQNILNNVSKKKSLEEIDELLTVDGQKYNTLRLLCLLHLSAGIDSDELVAFMHNYSNYFGPKYLYVFQLLANAGLLPELQAGPTKKITATKLLSNLQITKFQQTEFQANANRLRLLATSPSLDDDNKSQNSTTSSSNSTDSATSCPSYVFNGLYIPVIAQICAMISKFASSDDFGSKLGMLDMELHVPDNAACFTPKTYSNSVRQNELKEIFPLRNANFFVMVIGGVTYAEIAACKIIERTTGAKITIASDSIISGSDLIESAF